MPSLQDMLDFLIGAGFTVGIRNHDVRPGEPGNFMVADLTGPVYADGDDPYAIVGDDLTALIEEAFNVWA
jgi:hypothetical protein